MLDYTNAPAHLISPLCVDTNIDYTLDMNRFPGLNDPECMQQLALLPPSYSSSSESEVPVPRVCELCGNLIPYTTVLSQPCGFCVYYGLIDDSADSEEVNTSTDELFSLIASCDIDTEVESSKSSGEVQSMFEDFISSDSDISNTCQDTSICVTNVLSSPLPKLSPLSPIQTTELDSLFEKDTSCENCEQEVPSVNDLDVTFGDVLVDTSCIIEDLVHNGGLYSPAVHDTSRRKRKLSEESESKSFRKRQRSLDEMEDILLNCFGDFGHLNTMCSTDRNDVMTRFS
ncbi:hypothetical protein LOTGIDRAFT_229424 [Lottia gigantea]|uniref:Uncharacterized protein n=1 Tax=Lottia gigantea TaxID=225164 RepID=V3ZM82_LOTGI|nr:hypothetical protein LOTGIDRAFT_229424 [Lottia gigantea]ESO85402.1 hypothetical protein LOTGIDRAFT_229424 [Lottia gigantea]